jgi:hypothetical protein
LTQTFYVFFALYYGSFIIKSNSKRDLMLLRSLFKTNRSAVMHIIGKRASGKTTLLAKMIQTFHSAHPQGEIMFVSDMSSDGEWTRYPFVQHHLSRDFGLVFQRIVQDRNQSIPYLLIISDSLNLSQHDWLNPMVSNGRHYRCFVIIESQYMNLPARLQTNVDYVWLLPDNNRSRLRKLYESYGRFPTVDAFCSAMNLLCRYDCMVLDQRSTSVLPISQGLPPGVTVFKNNNAFERWNRVILFLSCRNSLRHCLFIDDLIQLCWKYT